MPLPTPKDAQDAVRLARCWEKAQNLRDAGYICRVNLPVVTIHKPDLSAVYFLNVQNGEVVHCTCPDFDKHQDYCKHLLFAQNLLDTADEELCRQAELEAEESAFMDACAIDGELRGSCGVEY
jgi:hypothetical protein